MGLVERPLVEPARVVPLEHFRSEITADTVVALVPQDRGYQQDGAGQRKAHEAGAAESAHDEQQRIAGQEGHDHHARLHEHDDEQQRVHPGPVARDEGREVLIHVQDEIDQELEDFQNGNLL
jgi:hypothetical protein